MQYNIPLGRLKSGRLGVRCITLGSGLGGGRTAAVLALLASAGRGGGWKWTAEGKGSADGGGRRWGRLARTVGVDLLTSARPETIHRGNDNVVIFCSKSGSEQKTQEGRPLPKCKDCACKKTQDLMPSAGCNHHKVL